MALSKTSTPMKSLPLTSTTQPKSLNYKKVIGEPAFEIPKALESNSTKQPHNLTSGLSSNIDLKNKLYPAFVDENSLRWLSGRVSEIRNEIAEIKAAAFLADGR